MTIYKLKAMHLLHNPDSHYFDKKTLEFFGEKLSEMEVLKELKNVNGVLCWVVKSEQTFGTHYSYFSVLDYKEVFE